MRRRGKPMGVLSYIPSKIYTKGNKIKKNV